MNDVSRYDPLQGAPLPVLGAWGEEEYRSLGLMSGLEVHQQLQTTRKLFCRCPAGRYSVAHHAEIRRHMRPTLSEMGDYDGTALMEFKTRKNITYLLNDETVCTYEMDDAPPFEMDPEALDIAVRVSLMLGLQVVDEIHIARKQYLDGSIPTGFQRTAIIGVQGEVPHHGRRIGIRQLSIEEDSCREVSDRGHDRVYRTDRLGMPLIETVTDPDMHTPWDVAAVCNALRRLARASGLVRTGVGAARQDVNVSIRGGSRVEIKGVPSIKRIPRLVHNEALRQRSLLAIRDVLHERGVSAASLKDAPRDVTSIVQGSEGSYLREAVAGGARAAAVPLPGFEGLVSTPTQPHTRFLKEFSDRVRVVACIDTLPNVICSTSEVPTLSSAEWGRIERACGVGRDTPIMVVWGAERDVNTATGEILQRAREACVGVPEETRQALPDDTTGFERVLPGPSRMYPDTDLPPVVLGAQRLARLASDLPPPPWERFARLRRDGVGEDLAGRLAAHPAFPLYAHLQPRLDGGPLNATGLASLLLDRDLPRPSSLPAAGPWWERTLDDLRAGRVLPEGIWWSDGEPVAALAPEAARTAFAEALAGMSGDLPEDPGPRLRTIMGRVMPALRGRVSGRQAAAWAGEATT